MHRNLFVFSGPRGYVPASKLTRYNHVAMVQPPPSPLLSATSCGPGTRRHSYTPGIQPVITMTTPCFQVNCTKSAMSIKCQVMNASQLLGLIYVSERWRAEEIDGDAISPREHQSQRHAGMHTWAYAKEYVHVLEKG